MTHILCSLRVVPVRVLWKVMTVEDLHNLSSERQVPCRFTKHLTTTSSPTLSLLTRHLMIITTKYHAPLARTNPASYSMPYHSYPTSDILLSMHTLPLT